MTLAEQWRAAATRLRGRLGLPPPAAGDARIVQVLGLGPGARLLVVEFAGRRLLIGQARGALVRLEGVIDEP